MRQEELGTYQMLWDCPHCGTEKLLGIDHRHCPACGAPQDPAARYYPSDEDKVAAQDHVYHGADKVCPACGTANGARSTFCAGCGAPLEGDAKEAAARSEHMVADGEAFAAETVKDAKAEVRARRQEQIQAAQGQSMPEPQGMSRGLKIGLIIGGIVLLVGALVYVLAFWKRQTTIEVEGHAWTRSIEVEVYKTVNDSAWCDQLPKKAKNVTRSKEQRSTKKVQDGETCVKKRKDNRDGTFKEVKECKPKYKEEPVYDDRCSFKIDKWVTARTEKASGQNKSDTLTWPAVKLKKKGTCLGCERQGSKSETYTLRLVDKKENETYECPFPLDQWKAVDVGSKWVAEVGVVTTKLDCDSFKPSG